MNGPGLDLRWQRVLPPLLIALAALAAYRGAFSAPLVFDDFDSIATNPTIRHLWPLGPALSPPFSQGQTVAGRPALNLSLAVNYAISGTRVWSYHAFNLAIHILAGLALYGIVRRTLGRIEHRNPLAFAVALLWTVHPLQTESVTYIVQRAESLMGLFYLLTIYCFIRYSEFSGSGNRKVFGTIHENLTVSATCSSIWAVLAVISCLLGMATKEVMASAPIMVFLYDRTFVSGSFREAWRRHRGLHLALASTWILLGYLVLAARDRGGTVGFGLGVGWGTYAATQPTAILRYLRLAVWPSPLIFDYGTQWVKNPWSAIPAALLLAGLAGSAVYLFFSRGWRWIGFLGVWLFVILAPTSLVPGNRQTAAEHRMYLALIPVIVLAVMGGGYGLSRLGRAALRIGCLTLVGAALALASLTYSRNRDYESDLGLWRDTVDKVPQNQFARSNLGVALVAVGRVDEASAQYREALRLAPEFAEASNNLGNVALREGRRQEALALFERAIRLRPRYPEAYSNLGVALTDVGRLDEAIAALRRALTMDPDFARAQFNLGVALAASGQLPPAMAAYEAAIALNPDLVEARLNLGNCLAQAGRMPEALENYRQALRLRPDYFDAHYNLAHALGQVGRYREAAAECEAAIRLRPDYGPARQNLERIKAALAAVDETAEHPPSPR